MIYVLLEGGGGGGGVVNANTNLTKCSSRVWRSPILLCTS